ncbi:MAG: hypothetical protein GYB35_02575 [Algicola sp.]|nr:hypothetical protein [Algicola sp.]
MSINKTIKQIFCILFFGVLIIPNLVMFLNSDDKKVPMLSFSNFKESIKNFNSYYTENFGLKPEMLDSYIEFKLNVLNDNPLPDRVLIGEEGWYFLGNHHENLFDDSFGNAPLSQLELEKIKNNIKAINENLASKGIEFHIVVPPNKHRVYAENLPYRMHQKPTRLEQINAFIKKEIDFEILDLKDTLSEHKSSEILYYKTNTHWNDIAAYIGYHKTLNTIDLDVPKDHISNYNREYGPIKRGDITEMINIKSDENIVYLSKKNPSDIMQLKSENHHLHFRNPNGTKKLIMYRDSFSNAWMRFFNSSFGETIYLRGYNIQPNMITNEKPDVVIFEIVERQLTTILLDL